MKKLATKQEFIYELAKNLEIRWQQKVVNNFVLDYNGENYLTIKGEQAVYLWAFNDIRLTRVIPNVVARNMSMEDALELLSEVEKLRQLMNDSCETLALMENATTMWRYGRPSDCDCEQWSSRDGEDNENRYCTHYPNLFDGYQGAVICDTCKDEADQHLDVLIHEMVKTYNKIPSKYEIVQALRVKYDTDHFITETMFHYMIGLIQESTRMEE